MQTNLVFISGALSNALVWRFQLPALAKIAKLFHADNVSHNSIEAMANQLLATMPEQFILMGYSMGGYVALEVMRQAAKRVNKLILISTSAHPVDPDSIPNRLKAIELVKQGKFTEMLAASRGISFSPKNTGNTELLQLKHQMALAVGPEAFLRQQQAIIHRRDYQTVLPTIKCPTLIITGTDDRILPISDSRKMASAIPSAKLIQLADCGHMPTWEYRAQMTQHLLEFIQE
ncbi:MAG: hydrolase [Gammaproteobacteria bacterium]|nr:hydrolase [Gammaproteobacteria bacterium]